MRLALMAASAFAIVATLVVLLLRWPSDVPLRLLALTGLSAFLVAADRTMSAWLTRSGKFMILATNRIAHSSTTLGLQLGFGLVGFGAAGLVFGQLGGQLVAAYLASRSVSLTNFLRIDFRSISASMSSAFKLRSYPFMILPGSVANEVATQLPLFVILGFYGSEPAGLLAMAQRLITAPVSLVCTAVGEVFRSEAAKLVRERGDCLLHMLRYLKWVACGAFVASITTYFVGSWVITATLGEKWTSLAPVVQVLALLMFGQILSMPFAQVVLLAGWQSWDFLWNVGRLSGVTLTMALCVYFESEFIQTLAVFGMTSLVFYVLNLIMQLRAARRVSGN